MIAMSINWKKIMRRTACLICAVCILLSSVQWNGSAEEAEIRYETVEISEGTLSAAAVTNVRKGPGKEHEVIAGMKPGDSCIVLGEENGWYKVEFGGAEGYVSKDLLNIRTYETQMPVPVETPAPTAMPGYELVEVLIGEVIAGENVYIRTGAGEEHEIIVELAPGDTCTVLEETLEEDPESEWCRVSFGEAEGYVLKEWLEITSQLIQVPLTEETPEPELEWMDVSVGTLTAQVRTNVRAGAGTEYEVIDQMSNGETCIVLGEQDGWYWIEFDGQTGWIAKEYIAVSTERMQRPVMTATPEPTETPEPTAASEPSEEATAAPEEGYEWAEVEVGTLIVEAKTNVRAGAGTEHEIIDRMSYGETCVVLGEEGDWYQIEFDGQTGWIAKEFIEVSLQTMQRPIATPTPEPTPEPTNTPEPTEEIVIIAETPVPTEVPEAEPGYEWTEVQVGALTAQARTNIRDGAGMENDIISYMSPGDTCIVLGEEGDWYWIEFKEKNGWIAKEFIEISLETMQRPIATPTPEPTATPEPAETSMPGHKLKEALVGTVVAEASVSFRSGPGNNYESIDYIAPGKTCIVRDDEMEWYEVLYNGQIGYVAKEYLEVAKKVTQVPLTTATPAPTEQPTIAPTEEIRYEMKEMQVGRVSAQAKINVRAGMGTEYDLIGQMAPGDSCFVLGEENGWYFVDVNGLTGYVSKEFMEVSVETVPVPAATATPPAPTEQPTAAPGYETVEVIEGTLSTQQSTNIRKGPGTNHGIITQMKPGQTCTVLGEDGDWYHIEYAGQRGYIMKEFIQTRSYMTQVEIIVEDPLDAYLVGFVMPRTMARRSTVTMEGVIESNIPMTSITVSIYDRRSMIEETAVSAGFARSEGRRAYDLINLSDEIRFGKLDAGEKRMTITVGSSNDEQVVYETDFYVLGECDDPISITGECSFTSRASRADRVLDGRYSTAWEPTAAGDEMTISVPAEFVSETLTLEWTSAPTSFELILDGESMTVNNEAEMLSFCIETGGAAQMVIRAQDASAGICEARVYAENQTPDVVHSWQPASGNVDMMVVVAHPGDEFLFFGGAIPMAAAEGKEILVVYMADCGRTRLAEAMDGLWAVGVRTHPVSLNLKNGRAKQYEDAIDMWGLEETYETLVELTRKYKPEVVLTHDIEGEDGDNQHKLTSAALRRAVLLSVDEGAYPESSAQYGVWDVKKTYIHRYEGNVLTLDADLPQVLLNGWTLREMTEVGFNKNRELMENFDLEDGEEYSPYSYGIIRTADDMPADELKNSFFENIGDAVEE